MKLVLWIVWLQIAFAFLSAQDDYQRLQNSLNVIYEDVEKTYNDTAARAKLIGEDLRDAAGRMDKALPEMDNLLFKIKGLTIPSQDLHRDIALIPGYQEGFSQQVLQVKELRENIENEVHNGCETISKWKEKLAPDSRRAELVDQSHALLKTVVYRFQKMTDSLDASQKYLRKITAIRDRAIALTSGAEDIVQRVNNLLGPVEVVRREWSRQQKELSQLPLRQKTLSILNQRAMDILKKIKILSIATLDLQYAEEQVSIIGSYEEKIKSIDADLSGLSTKIEEQLARFDADAESFKVIGSQVIAPYQDGINNRLQLVVQSTEVSLVEASGYKDNALQQIEKLRLCIGAIEEESDLVVIPDLNGLTQQNASATLSQLKLKADIKGGEPAPRRSLAGTVYDQNLQPGQKVLVGTVVSLRLYAAFRPVVPNVDGRLLDEASSILEEAGLEGIPKAGDEAPSKNMEGKVYSQFPRAYTVVQDHSSVELTYYSTYQPVEAEQTFSTTPFFVVCRLYVPHLKQDAPSKADLTIQNINFVQREMPYVIAVKERALDRYAKNFFDPYKALSSYIQIIGRDLRTGLSSQYDGALLFEVDAVYDTLDQVKQKVEGAIDLSGQDPLSYIELTEGNGLFSGTTIHSNIELNWKGGPVQPGWPSEMKEASFSLFRQLL